MKYVTFAMGLLGVLVTIAEFVSIFLCLPLLFFRKSRKVAGIGFFLSSYILGINLWLASALNLWNSARLWFWIGVFMFGIGVVPVSIVYTGIHGWWDTFWGLLGSILVVWVFRGLGIWARTKDSRNLNVSQLSSNWND